MSRLLLFNTALKCYKTNNFIWTNEPVNDVSRNATASEKRMDNN